MNEPLATSRPGDTISPLGLGAWAFGGVGWGPQDDRDSIAAIRRAVESGVSWIDTAAVYGDGHAERIVGSALRELGENERPLVFTKCGLRVDPATGRTFRDLRPASLKAECDESLRRLGLERIDLYQLHWPVSDPGAVAEAWGALGELRDQGKIRWAGVSNFDVDLLDRCRAIRPLDAVQLPLSLLSRAATGELAWARREQTSALTYSPLESGLLSGRLTRERLAALPDGDWRRRRRQFREPRLSRALELVERLRPIAAGLGASLVELAVAWTLAWPGVSGTIVGARDPGQVAGWAGASRLRLDGDAIDAIERALRESNAGDGPTRLDRAP